MLITFGKEMI